jgi:UDP-N-acetylglucosamine 2-epimerase (non-hydrolysing)
MRIVHVVGARPNFIKAAAVHAACARRKITQMVVHTGQHYDEKMSGVFFQAFGLGIPGVNLEVGSGTHVEQTASVMLRLEPVMLSVRPEWVIVYGDVNSTLAAALVCSKLQIPVAHVEAGLRSFDRRMPEEINRLVTDQIADALFTPSEDANVNLLREGIAPNKIRLVGNVMIDTLVRFLPLTQSFDRSKYPDQYALVTLHRPSNVDALAPLNEILGVLSSLSRKLPVIFPVHPRTRKHIASSARIDLSPKIFLIEPLDYLDFLSLERYATVVITDSGGVQEETTFLGVPCLTVRENTERPITIALGTNLLIGSDYARLEREVDAILAGNGKRGTIPPLWDGQTAERIADVFL